METLIGSIERITYYNPENGYSVLRLRPERSQPKLLDREGLITVTGNLPELAPGEFLSLRGMWVDHPRHGRQFQVEFCEQTTPATVAGIRRYLGSGLIQGIGPRLAARIVEHFGERTLEVIEEQPDQLLQVQDIGPKRRSLIAAAWEEQKQVKEIMLFLHSYGVSTNLAVKIYKQYEDQALQVVKTDPYRLARDIYGVGFKTADRIAQSLGLPSEHPSRIEAGVVYTLNQASEDGHVFMPLMELEDKASGLLDVTSDLVSPALERLAWDGFVVQEVLPLEAAGGKVLNKGPAQIGVDDRSGLTAVYLASLYYSEIGVAERLRILSSAMPSRLSDLPPAFVSIDPALSPEQESAIHAVLSNPLSVLTGGPGTGKTTAIRALIEVLESARKRYALASPTGRAAKRLSQATDRPASTLHRLLAYSPGEGFQHNDENPLPVDVLVVDEASMLDLYLAHNTLKAVLPGSHLLLVGDADQLPSVGAGDVLRDVISSGASPVTRLNVIFRQAANSHIVTNAHRINQGQMPIFPSRAGNNESEDFYLFPAQTPQEAADWVVDVVSHRIPNKFHMHPRDDIQVLAPMYRGAAGVTVLNERLQESLNPADGVKPEKKFFGQVFRAGDKVMQVRNNYDKEVFNGDIGYLFSIDHGAHTLSVDFDGRPVSYDWNEADQLVLAYVISVHKSQGSEFPAVVIPLVTQHYLMLQRNLVYTAVTRARQLCVVVGDRRAIGMAVNNNKVAHRYTALGWRINH